MWEVIKDWVFDIIQFFYNGVGDWGMAIIIITIIFRVIVAPLVHKSTTANFAMQKVQPLLQEVQTKFADDPVRQREEMQRLYAETKFNPLAGCLPMLIQMPVFIALYQVLYSMADRMPEGMTYQFYHLVPDLTMNPATAMSQGMLAFIPYLVLMLIFVAWIITALELYRALFGSETYGSAFAFAEAVLTRLAEVVTAESVDAVLVAGDVYDRAVPSADAQGVLSRVVARLRPAGVLKG